MKCFDRKKFVAFLIVSVIAFWIATGLTQSSGTNETEVIITIAGEQYYYQPRPELGYVIKIRQDESMGNAAIQSSTESLLPENAMPIGGLIRRNIWIVENEQPVKQVQNTGMLFASQSQVQYIAPLFSCNDETIAVIPEIVVRVKPEIQVEQVQAICEIVGCKLIKPMEFTTQEYLLQVLGRNTEAVFTAVELLNEVDSIEWAAPNTAFQPKLCGQLIPNDEYFPMQWHLHNTGQFGGTLRADINAPEAWEITAGDPNIVVAVLDSGVDSNHPDLIQNMLPGYDFFDDDNTPEPDFQDQEYYPHGTACAGIVAAEGNNGIGVAGVAWNCKIMPLRILGGSGGGILLTRAEIATAFRWAVSNGADILSNSWRLGTNPNAILRSAIVDVTKVGGIGRNGRGCVVFAAAGNDSSSVRYPAANPEVIAVGATDPNDVPWHYSNNGPELDITASSGCWINRCDVPTPMWTTDVSGPGDWDIDNIFDKSILDYTDTMAGTSGACPVVAGVAALVLSIEPELTSDEVRHFLTRSAKDLGDPGRDDYYGWGRVDARAALDMVLAKRSDLNNDWKVDEQDLMLLNEYIDTNDPSGDIAPAAKHDGQVDEQDIELLTRYLGTEIPEIGLMAYWKLDEMEGDVVYNSQNDPKYNAVLHGNPFWKPEGGIVNGAIELDGIDDYISTPFELHPEDGPFSIFAWIKGGVPGQTIISQVNIANWLMADSSEGKLATELASRRGVQTLVSEVVVTDGDWHRVGLTWDGIEKILYVDNEEVAADIQVILGSLEGGLYIGAGNALDVGTFWKGLIDDVRIYNRAITP